MQKFIAYHTMCWQSLNDCHTANNGWINKNPLHSPEEWKRQMQDTMNLYTGRTKELKLIRKDVEDAIFATGFSAALMDGLMWEVDHLHTEHDVRCHQRANLLEHAVKQLDTKLDGRRVKMPDVAAASFSGNLEEWLEFRTAFNSIYGRYTDLPDHQKLIHLRKHLEGEAKKALESLGSESGDYQRAWTILTSRFGNEDLIREKLMSHLWNIQPPRDTSGTSLRKVHDEVQRTYSRLITCDGTYRNQGSLKTSIEKCYTTTIRAEIIKDNDGKPAQTLDEFLASAEKIIERSVRVQASKRNLQQVGADNNNSPPGKKGGGGNHRGGTMAGMSVTASHDPNVAFVGNKGGGGRGGGRGGRGGGRGGQSGSQAQRGGGGGRGGQAGSFGRGRGGGGGGPPRGGGAGGQQQSRGGAKGGKPKPPNTPKICALCKDAHYITTCSKLREMSVDARMGKIKELNLCFKCLRGDGHGSKECTFAKPCNVKDANKKACGQSNHHYLLHRPGK